MKKYINKLFLVGSLLFLGTSCDNEAQITTLTTVKFPSEIEASSSTLVLTEDKADDSVLLLSWPAVAFPIAAPVTYMIQIDLVGDTSGNDAWQKSKQVTVGEDALSKSFLGIDLNKIAIDFGLVPGVKGTLVARVVATMDHTVYSDPITLTITPYVKSIVFGEIFMPGSYQGWNIDTAAALAEIQLGIYQGYMTAPAGSGLGFKLNKARNWDQFYGAGATNADLKNKSDTDFILPAEGSFQMKVNLNTLKWSATPYSWGIVGDGTPGSWDNSTPMSYDHQLKVWKVTANLVSGNLKFRLNNNWTVNYGPKNATDGIVSLDDPGAHYIGEAGTYDITFKINEIDPASNGYPATAIYTIKKK